MSGIVIALVGVAVLGIAIARKKSQEKQNIQCRLTAAFTARASPTRTAPFAMRTSPNPDRGKRQPQPRADSRARLADWAPDQQARRERCGSCCRTKIDTLFVLSVSDAERCAFAYPSPGLTGRVVGDRECAEARALPRP